MADNYISYENVTNKDDADEIMDEKVVIRCMHCLDCIVAVGKKRNSSYNERREYFLNNNNETYVDIILCNECKNKAVDMTKIIKQIRDGERIVLARHKVSDAEINNRLNKWYNLKVPTQAMKEQIKRKVEWQEKKMDKVKRFKKFIDKTIDRVFGG